jgi:hypothetical protein
MLQTLHEQPIATGYTARISRERLGHIRGLRRRFDKGGPEFWPLVERLGYRSIVVTPDWITARVSLAPLGQPPGWLSILDLRDSDAGWECDVPGWKSAQRLAGGRIDFGDPQAPHLCYGWGEVEDGGRWSIRGAAALVFAAGGAGVRHVRFAATPFLVPGRCERQRVFLELNGIPLGDWVLDTPVARELACDVPPDALRPLNELVFRLPDAEAPLALHTGPDRRTLGIRVAWVQLAEEAGQ